MIVFTPAADAGRLYMAYNNHVMRFYSDTGTEISHCDITDGAQLNLRLYPDPNNRFYINLKPYVSALINSRSFNDTTNAELNTATPEAFVYGFSNGTLLQLALTFTITFANSTTETATHNFTWLAGVEQVNDHHTFSKSGLYVLSPFRRLSANSYYLRYWQGYPFDMPLYATTQQVTLYNETNLLSATFGLANACSRLYFSDGRTDESLEDILPLIDGYNKLRLIQGTTPSGNDKNILLEKVPYKSGVYLKWLNKYGGYSYWLFEDTYSIDRSTKHLGEIGRDYDNLEDTGTRTWQMGKQSQDSIKIIAELLGEDQQRIVEGLLDSPKVYLFTGQPYSRSSLKDWTEVVLKTSGSRLKNAKQPLTNFSFDLELPERFTQTL